MVNSVGVYVSTKKDGTIYYRASITYCNKHISLGSYQLESEAHKAYKEAGIILHTVSYGVEDYSKENFTLSFHKWVVLINFRDNHIYFKNPIYLKYKYFIYYLDTSLSLRFDVDDLFYYANHKIMKRGGYLFVSDYGMQLNVLSRYGIKNFAVEGRDYCFANNDPTDYRYGNIKIINRYNGVSKTIKKGIPSYLTKIHLNGDIIIGRYPTENEAAIAYNKAVEILFQKGVQKKFMENYIIDLDPIEYATLYSKVRISKNIRNWS